MKIFIRKDIFAVETQGKTTDCEDNLPLKTLGHGKRPWTSLVLEHSRMSVSPSAYQCKTMNIIRGGILMNIRRFTKTAVLILSLLIRKSPFQWKRHIYDIKNK